eukprot:3471103-Rhodomonas_salina.2
MGIHGGDYHYPPLLSPTSKLEWVLSRHPQHPSPSSSDNSMSVVMTDKHCQLFNDRNLPETQVADESHVSALESPHHQTSSLWWSKSAPGLTAESCKDHHSPIVCAKVVRSVMEDADTSDAVRRRIAWSRLAGHMPRLAHVRHPIIELLTWLHYFLSHFPSSLACPCCASNTMSGGRVLCGWTSMRY